MRAIFLAGLVVGLTLAGGVGAQQPVPARVTVTGTVIDTLSGLPISGATVTFRAARRAVFTDSTGRFAVDAITTAAEQVQVRQIGYATVSFVAEIGPQPPALLIRLTPDPVELRAITALADRRGLHTIEGTVTDSARGLPLPRAVVWFGRSGGSAITDSLGHYVYDRGRAGFETVTVDVLGYNRRTTSRTIEEPWQRLDFALSADPIVLRGTAGLMRRMGHERMSEYRTARVQVYTEQDLARSGLHTVRDFTVWLGFDPLPCPVVLAAGGFLDCDTGQITPMPQTRSASNSTFLDGMLVPGGLPYLRDFPLHDFYAVVVALWTPQKSNGTNGRRVPVAISLYTKSYMRRLLGSGVRMSWQTAADTVPDAWRDR